MKSLNVNTGGLLFLSAVMFVLIVGGDCAAAPARQIQPGTGSSPRPDTLALVGGVPITGGEFRSRFEMSVYPGKGDPTMLERTKREFLYSMIAEKLLSQAAARSGIPFTNSENMLKREMEDVFTRDALFRKEIVPRATVTNDEILHGFDISVYKYFVDAFYFGADSIRAQRFYGASQDKKGTDIYKLAGSFGIRHDTLEIPYGESSAAIEEAFFGHEKGFVSKPTATVDGLVMFRILRRSLNIEFTTGSTSDRLHRIKQILVNRKQTKLRNEYIESVMKGVEVKVNYHIFRPLVYAIQRLLKKQTLQSYDPYYRLSPADLVELGRQFSSGLNEPLLSFKGGSISLEEVLQRIPTAMFAPEDATIPGITFALHGSLRFISQNHFLVRRAMELGLQNSPEVRYNVGMLLDAFRSYRMANTVTDTVRVTQKEVDDFFRKHHDEVLKSVMLKLRIFEADDINGAVAIYSKLVSEKRMAAGTDDSTGRWVSAYSLGEFGAVLSQLKNGDVYGPLQNNGKYLIYRLTEKKSLISDAAVKNSIDVARQMLIASEKREALSRYIAGLAENENVKIFGRELADLKVTPLQMLTYRLIGFGGRVLAVPTLYPREGWVKYVREERRPPQP